jgi:hypothetical protein
MQQGDFLSVIWESSSGGKKTTMVRLKLSGGV